MQRKTKVAIAPAPPCSGRKIDMALILVVDDRPLNREFLVTLLGYYDHTLLQATDGVEALQRVGEHRPDLIITDLLMPNMDGEELTRRLRADPATKSLPVIFYTATYRAREARQIADRVGVRQVLAKPSEPAAIMAAVAVELGIATSTKLPLELSPSNLSENTLKPLEQRINDKLLSAQNLNQQLTEILEGAVHVSEEQAQSMAALNTSKEALLDMQSLSLRLSGLIELGLNLAKERSPAVMIDFFCVALQDMLSGRYAGVVVLGPDGRALDRFAARGLDDAARASIAAEIVDCPVALQTLKCEHNLCTVIAADVHGLPRAHPPVKNLLACNIAVHGEVIGWMYVAERLGDGGFRPDDQRIAAALGAQFATAWENLAMYGELDKRVAERTAQLQAASFAKDLFLSSMSHELRTPLNAILGFAQLLEASSETVAQRSENIEQIQKAGWHLLELVNEVLDLGKIEAGAIRLSMESVELREVLGEILQLIDPLASRHRIVISTESNPAAATHVCADRTRLRQVLLNLLTNAVKYNCANGSVTIAIEQRDDATLRLAVTDTGAGLTQAQQLHLFEAFNRLGRENEGIEGTGIGLIITRRLVEAMGGAIGVVSTPGKGCTFWIELAAAAAPAAAPSSLSFDANATAAPTRLCKLLYVEDNPVNLLLVSKIVATQSNLIMLSANTGAQGLEMARIHRPDIILLDIGLPDMSGLEVLTQLQLDEHTRSTPVLALSAHAAHESIKEAMAAGFRQYITKPIRVKQFLDTIYQCL
jgi:signal transduction histidine kinase/response regulator RpfG family c-di-GMP phosphodiesterase